MQFHLVRVPVKLIFLAKPKFVLAVGCYAYRPDTASVAGTLEGYESILRYVLHHAGGIFILKRPGNRLVRHTESLGIIHYPAFIGRNHDVPGTYDAIHKERQGLAFPTLTGGNIVRVSNIIRTISPFRLPLGIHGIDKTPGNRGMRFQFGSVQSVFRKTAGIDFQHRRVDIDFERLAERIHRLVVKTGKARHIDADIHPLVGLICPFQRGDFFRYVCRYGTGCYRAGSEPERGVVGQLESRTAV